MTVKSNEIIAISDRIHNIVFKRFVQVNHPNKIEPRVLESYIKGENNLILKYGEKIAKSTVVNIGHSSMAVELLENDLMMERDENVLIVFDHPTYNTTFALQTKVERRSFLQYSLRYQDPRFENRYNFKLKNETDFFLLPFEIYNLIESKEVHLTRQTILDKENNEDKIIISENLYNASTLSDLKKESTTHDKDDFHPVYRSLLDKKSRKASLKNISLGGLCLLMDEEPYENKGLILVKVEMPGINSDNSSEISTPLALHLFGSIRGISKVADRYGVHIAFLKRLDTHFADSHFRVLEKYYSNIRRPL